MDAEAQGRRKGDISRRFPRDVKFDGLVSRLSLLFFFGLKRLVVRRQRSFFYL